MKKIIMLCLLLVLNIPKMNAQSIPCEALAPQIIESKKIASLTEYESYYNALKEYFLKDLIPFTEFKQKNISDTENNVSILSFDYYKTVTGGTYGTANPYPKLAYFSQEIRNCYSGCPAVYNYNVWGTTLSKSVIEAKNTNITFHFGKELIVGNSDYTDTEIDFGDGEGFKAITLTNVEKYPVKYHDFGIKTIKFKRRGTTPKYCNGNPIYDTYVTETTLDLRPSRYNEIGTLSAPKVRGTGTNSANYKIYNGNDNVFDKPIIVIEGFNILKNQDPDMIHKNLVSSGIYKTLTDKGFDLMIVQFSQNNDYIENNAQALKEVFKKCKQLSPYRKSAVLGVSMGGVIARLAIKEMENQNQDHHVGTYLSYDAPHHGAEVPVGYQTLINDISNSDTAYDLAKIGGGLSGVRDAKSINSQINSPAGKQLIMNHYSDQTLHAEFQSKLDNIGFPTKCRNVSITCGNTDGNLLYSNFFPGEKLHQSKNGPNCLGRITTGVWSSKINASNKVSELIKEVACTERNDNRYRSNGDVLMMIAPGGYIELGGNLGGTFVNNRSKFSFVPINSSLAINKSDVDYFKYLGKATKETVSSIPKPMKVWCKKSSGMSTPKIHYWNTSPSEPKPSIWPGTDMVLDPSKGKDWYVHEFTNATQSSILFHDNSGNAYYKTPDMHNVVSGCYDMVTKTWVDCPEMVPPAKSITVNNFIVNKNIPFDAVYSTSINTAHVDISSFEINLTTNEVDFRWDVKKNINNLNDVITKEIFDYEAPVVNVSTKSTSFNNTIKVALNATDDTDSAPRIYYTLDGTDPSTSSSKFILKGEIEISKTTTLKFYAEDYYFKKSNIQTEKYTLNQLNNPPILQISPKGSTFSNSITVNLSATDDTDSAPKIYYTTNGTEPTTSSPSFVSKGSLTLSQTATLKAFAIDNTSKKSTIVSEIYQKLISDTTPPVITITPVGGNYSTEQVVVISAKDNIDLNPIIYYTLDGSTPTTSSLSFVKTGTLNISSATTLKLFAKDNANQSSQVITHNYTFNKTTGVTVWFKKPTNMQAPKIHYWNVVPAQSSSNWPGITMNPDSSKGTDWYKYTIENASSCNLLFHDGAGYQTPDLPNITGGCYDGNTKTWINCNQDNAPTVSVSLSGGNYTAPITVNINASDDKDANPIIYYTLDGSTPTTSSLSFVKSGTLNISSATTLKLFAKDNANQSSQVITHNYTFNKITGVTVWFKKPTNIQAPRIHYWNVVPAQSSSNWPGITMNPDSSKGTDWYKYTIENASSCNLVFHDNAGYKTPDLVNITGGCYDGNTKTWIDCNQTTPSPIKVWCKKSSGMGTPKIHYWNTTPSESASNWPGKDMTPDTSKGSNWFVYTFTNATQASLLFHDNSGNSTYKSPDMHNITGGCYDMSTKTWVNCSTALKEASEEAITDFELKVYPNPTDSMIYFESNTSAQILFSIKLFSVSGELILMLENVNSINIENLPSAMYLYEAQTQNEVIKGKIIKN